MCVRNCVVLVKIVYVRMRAQMCRAGRGLTYVRIYGDVWCTCGVFSREIYIRTVMYSVCIYAILAKLTKVQYRWGWPELYICNVYDLEFGGSLPKTPWIHRLYVWFWPTLDAGDVMSHLRSRRGPACKARGSRGGRRGGGLRGCRGVGNPASCCRVCCCCCSRGGVANYRALIFLMHHTGVGFLNDALGGLYLGHAARVLACHQPACVLCVLSTCVCVVLL